MSFLAEKYVYTRDRLEFSMNKDSQLFSSLHSQALSAQEIFARGLGTLHYDKFYDQMYKSGDEKNKERKRDHILLGLIPFYDCVNRNHRKRCRKGGSSLCDGCSFIASNSRTDDCNDCKIWNRCVKRTSKGGIKGGIKGVLRNSKYFSLPVLNY